LAAHFLLTASDLELIAQCRGERALDSGGSIWPKGLSSVNCLDE
jgi:hypothetical protein